MGDPQILHTNPFHMRKEVKTPLLRTLFCSSRSMSIRESAPQRSPLWEMPQANRAGPELKQVLAASFLPFSVLWLYG